MLSNRLIGILLVASLPSAMLCGVGANAYFIGALTSSEGAPAWLSSVAPPVVVPKRQTSDIRPAPPTPATDTPVFPITDFGGTSDGDPPFTRSDAADFSKYKNPFSNQ